MADNKDLQETETAELSEQELQEMKAARAKLSEQELQEMRAAHPELSEQELQEIAAGGGKHCSDGRLIVTDFYGCEWFKRKKGSWIMCGNCKYRTTAHGWIVCDNPAFRR